METFVLVRGNNIPRGFGYILRIVSNRDGGGDHESYTLRSTRKISGSLVTQDRKFNKMTGYLRLINSMFLQFDIYICNGFCTLVRLTFTPSPFFQ